MERRRFLAALAAAAGGALAAGPAAAIGKRSRFVITELRTRGGPAQPRTEALRRLIWEIILRTSIDGDYRFPVVDLADRALFSHPFLYLSGADEFPEWNETERGNVRRFLRLGGSLLVDDAAGRPASGFDRSFRREAARLLDDSPLVRLDDDHTVFRSYYLLRGIGGRVMVSPFLEGVHVGDRTPLIYCRNDLGGAWSRDALGRWSSACTPGGEAQRQAAFRLGINIVLYALTVNYKQDQVHDAIIRQRSR